MKAIFIILTTFFLSITLNGQTNVDSSNIGNARKILNKYFKNIWEANFLIYGINENYIVLKKQDNYLKLFYSDKNAGLLDSAIIDDTSIQKMFSNFNCIDCFDYSTSDTISKYNFWHRGFIYFLYWKNDKKVCEFSLPILFQLKNWNRRIYPIDDKLHEFLFGSLLYYIGVKYPLPH
jgi:hypothetical protein